MDITPFILPILLVVVGAIGSIIGIRLRRSGRDLR
jgi:hypothetical protein